VSSDLNKTFVGFGFGPIQSGLFLYEARMSGNFRRLVVAEVVADLVRAVRANRGRYTVNIARKDRIDHVTIEGVEIYDPRDAGDRAALVEAVRESDELATCLPSVRFYDADEQTSVAGMIAEGISRRTDRASGRPTVIYAAENHNHAAEILRGRLTARAGGAELAGVQTLNTVIGKMSGVIADRQAIDRIGLKPITPDIPRAILVEEFNRILVSRIALAGFRRGIEVFLQKDDLLPFEEAKLYGHNAIHSLIAYLADLKGMRTIAQAGSDRQIMHTARQAFLAESGQALIRRHAGLGDPLFTPAGYEQYAEDLLERMVNPYLNDQVRRVGRNPVRKLGYADRLYGAMRLSLDCGVRPERLALGAAAGVVWLIRRGGEPATAPRSLPRTTADLTNETLRHVLLEIWGDEIDQHADTLVAMTSEAIGRLGEAGYEL